MAEKEEIKYNLELYKKYLEDIIIDKGICKEILNKITRFHNEGLVVIYGKNLYGKIREISGDDYLDIKCNDDVLNCSYTKHNLRKIINIVQSELNGNIKIDRKESLECVSLEGHNEILEQQKIYFENNLIYESLINNNQDYCIKDGLVNYSNKGFIFNRFSLMKKWYFPNKSIVYYKLIKDFFDQKYQLKESYLICVEPYMKNGTLMYDYENLDAELFNKLMLGKVGIEEVVEKINSQKVIKIYK